MGGEGGTFPLLGVTPVGGTSKMEVFWGRWGTRGTLGAGVLILDVFFEHFRRHWETLWQPWGSWGTPLSPFFGPVGAILQPRGGIDHAVQTCVLAASRCQKVGFLQGADSDYI